MGIIVPSHRAEHGIKVLHLPDDDMLDLSFALQGSPDSKTACTNQDAAVPFEHVLPDDQVCHTTFIFNRYEHDAFGGPGSLPHEHKAGQPDRPAITDTFKVAAAHDATGGQGGAQEVQRMPAKRQPGCPVVFHDFSAFG